MKSHKVTFRPAAERDLLRVYEYIASEASVERAGLFIDRIEQACFSLQISPERGTPRDDLRPGLRIMGFERGIAIVFQVRRTEVVIVRILYGGQDYERAFRSRSSG